MTNNELKTKLGSFELICRKAGLRVTPQRMAIYKTLLESGEHPSAAEVFRKIRRTFPAISMDTVNRTLLTLSEIGAAFVVEGSGSAKRFDADLEGHQHFRCIKCERIIDFYHKPFDNIPIPKNLGRGLVVLRRTVYFEGICDLCAKGRNSHRPRGSSSLRKDMQTARPRR